MQSTSRNAGESDIVTSSVRAILLPIANGLYSGTRSASDFLHSIGRAGAISANANRLQQLETAASQYTAQLEFLRSENSRLRSLILLPEYAGKTKVPAYVTGYFPFENRMTLNVGKSSGIKPGMAAVTADGLAGIVQTVDSASSQLLLLSSPQIRFGAIVHRSPPPAGLIRGESVTRMVLEIIDVSIQVKVGDIVLTSGHSDIIPAGIPVGLVSERTEYPEFGIVRCQVFPNVSPGDIREVLILK